jgi:hypothetical protein
LFVSIIVFASVIAAVLTGHRLTRALAGAVALLCATGLALEAAGHPNGPPLQNLGQSISFILLILTLGTMTALGRLPGPREHGRTTPAPRAVAPTPGCVILELPITAGTVVPWGTRRAKTSSTRRLTWG